MSFENVIHMLVVFISGGTFVVNNEVVALSPIGVIKDWQRWVRRFAQADIGIDANIGT